MSKNEELILNAIEQSRPDWSSNSQLETRTGVKGHSQVFKITERLKSSGLVEGEQRGREWFFRSRHAATSQRSRVSDTRQTREPGPSTASRDFESRAREVLGCRLGTSLAAQSLPGVPKKFDLVSADFTVAGDAKYFEMVRGTETPPAKFSIIAEHVWLLEKTNARCRFSVFGNNRLVPTQWLKKYGRLAGRVAFLFLDKNGTLEALSDAGGDFSGYRTEPIPWPVPE